jgi:excisionase family DNA binding protein
MAVSIELDPFENGSEITINPVVTSWPQTQIVVVRPTFTFVTLPVSKKKPEADKNPPGTLLSVGQVASILGVTEDTIRKYAREQKITSVRLSKVDVRFRQADVDEFIASRLHRRKISAPLIILVP